MKASVPIVVAVVLGISPIASAQDQPTDPKVIGRILHSMVWTGKEVLVWGGGSEGMFFGHGLRIDRMNRRTTRPAIPARPREPGFEDLDPFCGVGTIPVACKLKGRVYVGVE